MTSYPHDYLPPPEDDQDGDPLRDLTALATRLPLTRRRWEAEVLAKLERIAVRLEAQVQQGIFDEYPLLAGLSGTAVVGAVDLGDEIQFRSPAFAVTIANLGGPSATDIVWRCPYRGQRSTGTLAVGQAIRLTCREALLDSIGVEVAAGAPVGTTQAVKIVTEH